MTSNAKSPRPIGELVAYARENGVHVAYFFDKTTGKHEEITDIVPKPMTPAETWARWNSKKAP